MVKFGMFEVKLINAETGQPFPEHKSKEKDEDGKQKIYVKVEPNVEYKIEVRSEYKEYTYYDIEIDGVDLGCYWALDEKSVQDSFEEVRGTTVTKRAFRFAKLPRMCTGAQNITTAWTGTIVVSFCRCVKLRDWEEPDTVKAFTPPKWKEGQLLSAANIEAKSKGSKTVQGKVLSEYIRGPSKYSQKYRVGALIGKITLHYCSVYGLMDAGIVGKTMSKMSWERHRMWFPSKQDGAKETIMQQRIEFGATDKKHSDVVARKTFDLFDLSGETSDSGMENVPDDSDTEVGGSTKKRRRIGRGRVEEEPSQATNAAIIETSSVKIKMEEDSSAEQTGQVSVASPTPYPTTGAGLEFPYGPGDDSDKKPAAVKTFKSPPRREININSSPSTHANISTAKSDTGNSQDTKADANAGELAAQGNVAGVSLNSNARSSQRRISTAKPSKAGKRSAKKETVPKKRLTKPQLIARNSADYLKDSTLLFIAEKTSRGQEKNKTKELLV